MRSRQPIGLFGATLILAAIPWVQPPARAAGADAVATRHAADCLPEGLVAVAFLRDGDQQLEAVRKIVDAPAIQDSAGYKALVGNPDLVKGRIFAAGLAAAAGTDLWKAGGALLGRELAAGLMLREGGQPQIIVASVARDPALLQRIIGQVHAMAGLEVEGKPDGARSRLVGDVRVFSLSPEEHHCFVDGVLLVSNSGDLLQASLEAMHSGKGRWSAAKASKVAADVPPNAVAYACGDLSQVRKAVAGGKPLPEQISNPLGGLIFGAWWHTLSNAEQALVWITAEGDSIALEGKVISDKALPETHRGFNPKAVVRDSWSAEKLPGFLAEVTVTRGWADLFAERESLLTLPAAGDLVNFSTVLTTLMGQLDFVNDFLPNIAGPVRLIVTRQSFEGKSFLPTPKLPAFALVIPLKPSDSMELSRRLASASQMAVTFLNFDAAQKNQPSYLIENQKHGAYTMLTTSFTEAAGAMPDAAPSASDDKKPATRPALTGVRYNFAPAAAVVENRYIIATSADLLGQIVDAVAAAGQAVERAAKPPADSLTLNARELATVLADNRAELVTNNMLDKDHSREQAEKEIDGLLGLLRFAERLDLSSSTSDRQARASIKLTLRGLR